jgi:hypothetical protein
VYCAGLERGGSFSRLGVSGGADEQIGVDGVDGNSLK